MAGKFRGAYRFSMVAEINVTTRGVGIAVGMCVVDGGVERVVGGTDGELGEAAGILGLGENGELTIEDRPDAEPTPALVRKRLEPKTEELGAL